MSLTPVHPMSEPSSRRDFLKTSGLLTAGTIAAGSVLSGTMVPKVHAAEDNTIKIGLVGCGGRGRGAVSQALHTQGPTKLVAIGDAFIDRAKSVLEFLQKDEFVAPKLDVGDHVFGDLDNYKKVMDVLSPGDVIILATPPAFRPHYFAYAVEKGLHIFAEKPLAVDTPGCKKILAANEVAKQKNLKVAVGLNNRHYWRTEETIKAIQDGEIGDIIACWVYRLQPEFPFIHNPNLTPLQNQLLGFQNWTWGNGSYMVDWMIHNIDICCWARGEQSPVSIQGQGGRQVRKANDQMYDHCAYEYRFGDGVKMMVQLRQITKAWHSFRAVIQGTKGCAVVGEGVGNPVIYKGLKETPENIVWKPQAAGCDSYQEEHNRLFKAIRENSSWNEIERGVQATFVSIMGRMAVDSGLELSYDTCWNSTYELAPNIENWTLESEPPVKPDENGKYHTAIPGETKEF